MTTNPNDAYIAGIRAFQAGEPLDACPHWSGSREWRNWRRGWMGAARYQQEKAA